MRRLKPARLLYWAGPMLFCIAWHFTALRSWFSNDDFAWLSLPVAVNSWHDLLVALFEPMAQGTIRVFSERLFFLTLGSIFDLAIIPFKIVVFSTQFVNLALVMWIVRRLTGSRLAGLLAPVLWCAGTALAEPLGWSSAYNEILITLCFLLGFFFRLKWIDTGERRYVYLEWLPFLFGFGVLETIVIYPALMMLYAICCAPKTARSTLPLFLPAIAFVIFHFTYIPASGDPKYQLVLLPASILNTLWTYWAVAVGTFRPERPETLPIILLVSASAVLGGLAALQLYRHKRLAIFLLLWFPLTLAPVLPLENHISEYYLTVPTLGLAMLAAWAAATPNRWGRTAAIILIPVYLFCSFEKLRPIEDDRFARGRSMRHLVKDMERHEEETEGKFVLLQNVNEELLEAGLLDRPLNLIGLSRVYIAPGNVLPGWVHAEYPDVKNYEISWQDAYDLLSHGRAVVFSVAGHAANTTAEYAQSLALDQALRGADILNIADPDAASHLEEGWYPVEGNIRWSKREASLWMTSSLSDQRLYLRGYCPESLLQKGPFSLTVEAEGKLVATFPIKEPNWFTVDAALPEQVSGKGKVNIHLRVSREYHAPNDQRELGLIFATFTVQK